MSTHAGPSPVRLGAKSPKTTKLNMVGLLFGTLFGGILASVRLHEYDTIHAMLRLDEPDVYLLMASAVAVSAPLLWLLERGGMHTPFGGRLSLSRSMPEAHHLKGGALFGVGWAIAGTCPAPALVMLSSGATLGLVSIPGIFVGLWLFRHNSERQLRVEVGSGDGEHREIHVAPLTLDLTDGGLRTGSTLAKEADLRMTQNKP